ncbi:FeoB-associated Cys-rich membrane protein [Petralouisia muris]|uniref:FeoB-associated Cys-rich membrane protein n=1 Tax=Petralouisia muris TaxID=3032872 RepID=A0AC61RR65_9FIRM|nr:FeoB-associated Cys-rich membrane protein [Petralouisia muris]TGY91040.1 FeoB-associated Cys-rich membrane protein [Petralouisia muris]
MIATGIIVIGIIVYAVWAAKKIHKKQKNGTCCGGGCSGCVDKKYCNR